MGPEWKLRHLGDNQLIPPFVLELFMKNGQRYYVHSRASDDDESRDELTLRVWDLRAFEAHELDELRRALNRPEFSRAQLARAEQVHPKLDWAILWAHMSDVLYCVEWHDRNWPVPEERQPLGFINREEGPGPAP